MAKVGVHLAPGAIVASVFDLVRGKDHIAVRAMRAVEHVQRHDAVMPALQGFGEFAVARDDALQDQALATCASAGRTLARCLDCH